MLRPAVAALSVSSSAQQTTIPTLASRSYSRRSKPALQTSEGEVSATKKWLAAHDGKPEMIPRSIAEIKRGTRSSKVKIQVTLIALSKYVTQDMISDIKGLACYDSPSDKLTIQADECGRQRGNEEDCFRKYNFLLKDIAEKVVSRESDAKAEELPHDKRRSMSWTQRKDYEWKKICEAKRQRGQKQGFRDIGRK